MITTHHHHEEEQRPRRRHYTRGWPHVQTADTACKVCCEDLARALRVADPTDVDDVGNLASERQ